MRSLNEGFIRLYEDIAREINRRAGSPTSHSVEIERASERDGLLSEGQMSDHKGARLVLDALPPASHLIADRGYDSAWSREKLEARGIEPCIPSSQSRKVPYAYDTVLYRQRH